MQPREISGKGRCIDSLKDVDAIYPDGLVTAILDEGEVMPIAIGNIDFTRRASDTLRIVTASGGIEVDGSVSPSGVCLEATLTVV